MPTWLILFLCAVALMALTACSTSLVRVQDDRGNVFFCFTDH